MNRDLQKIVDDVLRKIKSTENEILPPPFEPITTSRVIACAWKLYQYDCVLKDCSTSNRQQVISLIRYKSGVRDTKWILPDMEDHVAYDEADEFPYPYYLQSER